MDIDGLGSTSLAAIQNGQPAGGTSKAGLGSQTLGGAKSESQEKTGAKEGGDSVELSQDAQRIVAEMKARDQEVRAHEAAHMAAGSGLVRGGATYSFQQGPDGKRYAVGGEVSIDTSAEKTPEATRLKAQQIRAAALAPANPSTQDRAVAAKATQMEAEAAGEIAAENTKAIRGSASGETKNTSGEASTGRMLDIVA